MWYLIASVIMALCIGIIMLLKARGRSVFHKPTWKGGIISFFVGLLPLYLLLCMFGVMGKKRADPEY